MKKILIITLAAVCAVACYEDYIGDYKDIACGFANQTDVRTFVVGEGMAISTGVALGGVIENTEDRYISFGTDYSLVNNGTYTALKNHSFSYIANLMKNVPAIEALPADMYEFETTSGNSGTVLIPKGEHLGQLKIRVDSVKFLADASNVNPRYVIPIVLTDGNGTDLISGRETSVIAVRYENMLFGNWYHGSSLTVTDAAGNVLEQMEYPLTVPQEESKIWTLTTVEPFALTVNAVGNEYNGSKAQMKITLNDDDTISISAVPGATYEVEADGESRLVRNKRMDKREIILGYKYTADGKVYHFVDKLTFRNRIRDGVNEWQDENSSHYE